MNHQKNINLIENILSDLVQSPSKWFSHVPKLAGWNVLSQSTFSYEAEYSSLLIREHGKNLWHYSLPSTPPWRIKQLERGGWIFLRLPAAQNLSKGRERRRRRCNDEESRILNDLSEIISCCICLRSLAIIIQLQSSMTIWTMTKNMFSRSSIFFWGMEILNQRHDRSSTIQKIVKKNISKIIKRWSSNSSLVAQWITRLTTNQEIAGSIPAKVEKPFMKCRHLRFLFRLSDSNKMVFPALCKRHHHLFWKKKYICPEVTQTAHLAHILTHPTTAPS